MDFSHCKALSQHNEDEVKPKNIPIEHWKKGSTGKYFQLHPGFVFPEKIEHNEFGEKILLNLNNHMRKKGVESCTNRNSTTHINKHGDKTTRKFMCCSQKMQSKKKSLSICAETTKANSIP